MRPRQLSDIARLSHTERVELARALAGVELAEVSQNTAAMVGEATMRENLARWASSVLNRLADPGRAASARVVSIGDDHRAVVRLCTVADGQPLRFVGVDACDMTFSSQADVSALLAAVRESCADFKPRRITVFQHTPADPSRTLDNIDARCQPYKRCFGECLAGLRDGPAPPGAERFVLSEPMSMAYFDAYARMYDDFWSAQPYLKPLVARETREDLERFQREGCLRLLHIDGAFAGVMAAKQSVLHGLRGWCMRERVLSTAFRGQGLGPASLWTFLQELPVEEHDLLWGFISVHNQPSIRTAQRIGRKDLGGLYAIELA